MTPRLKSLQCSPLFVPGLMFLSAILFLPIVLVIVGMLVGMLL